MVFIEYLLENCKAYPDKTAFIDGATGKKLSYAEVDALTAKVYAYLSDRGIGREDFVMINLPRGIYALVAALGVWRAGAAYVIVEEGMPTQKRDYIYKDCGCSLLLRTEEFAQILELPGKEGYKKTDLHDASYAVYTSGTTGNPKGVIHEYGTMEENRKYFNYEGQNFLEGDVRFLLLSPLSFVATVIAMQIVLEYGGTMVIPPYTVVKNKEKLLAFMAAYKITVTFFTPSLLQLNPKFHPELKILFLSSEPAKNIYHDGITLYNVYAQSETGFFAGIFRLDKAYEITPIGKLQDPDHEIIILNEEGKRARPGEMGEVCFENPYFRGYMHLPEETERAFQGGIYHTGDIGKYLPDGNVVLLGRNDDMVKVNGNRVEPGEIEKAMKEVLGLHWTAAKAFVEDNRVYICGYYNEDIDLDMAEAKKELIKRLPAYMVPSHFIKLDEIPLNPNGKLSRKSLPKPDFRAREDYIAPETDTEKTLCDAMQTVLHLEKVGVVDDFYELGGDSISSMKLLQESGLEGLTTDMIFRGRSAREIAQIYRNEAAGTDEGTLRMQEDLARRKDHPLLMEQLAAFDYQLYAPRSTMWNLPCFFRFGKEIDLPRLKEAVENVLKAHGVFSTILKFNEEGELIQRYTDALDKTVEIEKDSEAELVDIREELVRPFKLVDSPLYRFRIFETERGGYLFFDLHHLIGDGTSMYILIDDIARAYQGEPLEEDLYYHTLSRLEQESRTENYAKAREYYLAREDSRDWARTPVVDHASSAIDCDGTTFILPVDEEGYQSLQDRYGIGRNAFFVGIAAFAMAAYNKVNDVSILWTYNGRGSKEDDRIVGMMIRDITFYLSLKEGMTVGDFFREVRDQMVLGLSYCSYPHANMIEDQTLCILYQSGLGELDRLSELGFVGEELPEPFAGNDNLIDLEIYDTESGTQVELNYIPSCYEEESMQRFRRLIMKTAALFVQYAQEPDRQLEDLYNELT